MLQKQVKHFEVNQLPRPQKLLQEVLCHRNTNEVQESSMEYKLELKPAQIKDGQKYKIIQITDITLHSPGRRPTKSVGEKVKKAFDKNEPGRIYQNLEKIDSDTEQHEGYFKISILDQIHKDPSFMKMLKEEESKGYKVLLSIPKDGIPIYEGKDSKEFIDSKKGKRILRKIAKDKNRNINITAN